MQIERQITLPDGRRMVFAEYGRPDGNPVIYFHGVPSSRLEPRLLGDDVLRDLKLRIIAPDRPGMGGSDFQPSRRLMDWAADVTALADTLGLDRFALLGVSGGGPYVAACAARIPARICAAVIASGAWRMDWPEARPGLMTANRIALWLVRRLPLLLPVVLSSMRNIGGGPRHRELAAWKRRLPTADYAVLEKRGRFDIFGEIMRESLRQGTRGPAWDLRLGVRDFGFRGDEIRIPMTWFHGDRDRHVPIALARRAANSLPSTQFVTYAGEAHFSTICNHLDDILDALAGG